MAIISSLLVASLLSASCDGLGLTSTRTTTRKNVPVNFLADPYTQKRGRHRVHQIIRKSSATLLIERRCSSHILFSTGTTSLPVDDERNNRNSKTSKPVRPEWALPWMPTWLITLRPITQLFVGLFLYIFHLRILTQHGITFPFQLIPNDEGWFQSIGLDSLAGIFSLFGMIWLRKASLNHHVSLSPKEEYNANRKVAIPSVWADPTEDEAPWRLRRSSSKSRNKNNDDAKSKKSDNEVTAIEEDIHHPRPTSIVAFILLTFGYFSTGRFSLLFENALYAAAGYGLPLTVPMHRRLVLVNHLCGPIIVYFFILIDNILHFSLVVLLGHLAWVAVGSGILAAVLSPKPFFGGGWKKVATKKKKVLQPYRWYTNQWNTYWIWWTIGGYFVSAWLFNIADFLNQIVLPPYLFAQQSEGVVSQLINPENNDFLASLMGYIAPCLTAPWWEEVLYRGYLLPALRLFMGFKQSVFVSGVLFSIHHLSVMGAIPLAVLGWFWAALYAKSGNLLVTILIHGMWNSRVFLGSWLGL